MYFKLFNTFMIWNPNLGYSWGSSNFINPSENLCVYVVQLQLCLKLYHLSFLVIIYTHHFIYYPLGLITHSFISLANISPLHWILGPCIQLSFWNCVINLKGVSNSLCLKQNSESSSYKSSTNPLFTNSLNGTLSSLFCRPESKDSSLTPPSISHPPLLCTLTLIMAMLPPNYL